MTLTEPELEDLVTETLRAKAAQVVAEPAAFDPAVVRIGGPERPRRRPPLLVAAAVLVLVVAAAIGLAIVLTGADGHDARPAGPEVPLPVNTLTIDALPTLRYQAAELVTVPGPNEIRLLGHGGTHTLVFEDPALAWFELSVPNGPDRAVVDLEPGRDYVIHDAIPGHRRAGMEGVIHVIDPATATKGTEPAVPPTLADGSIDTAQLPDFIPVVTNDGSAGYVLRAALMDAVHGSGVHTVFGEDLRTVVGHMYPGRGFVPLGIDPETVAQTPSSTAIVTTTTLGGGP
jgi:hypothetical protein